LGVYEVLFLALFFFSAVYLFLLSDMAGRLQAPLFLVPNDQILSVVDILVEDFNLLSLIPLINDLDGCISWLEKRRLLRDRVMCPTCNQPCRVNMKKDYID
jgi:hypothetical protein